MAMRWSYILLLLPLLSNAQHDLLQQAISMQYTKPDSDIRLSQQIIDNATDDTLRANAFEVKAITSWNEGS